jgi:hypothetical protein
LIGIPWLRVTIKMKLNFTCRVNGIIGAMETVLNYIIEHTWDNDTL